MKKGIIHLLLSLILSFAVTDFIWVELIQDEDIVAEIETKEQKEEVREFETPESKHELDDDQDYTLPQYHNLISTATGFVKRGNSFIPLDQSNGLKRYILYHQLRIHC